MNIKNTIFGLAGAFAMTAGSMTASAQVNVNPTEPYEKTQVQPQIRLNLENDTDAVHFIRDNTDPFVVTKVYQLKNADPYELLPYVRNAVNANKITTNPTRVECIKYNNGVSFIVVSAEEDRFGPQPDGMGIDEFIARLDQQAITSSAGSVFFLYFPMYRNASVLDEMIRRVGMDSPDSNQLQRGRDTLSVDEDLNALFFYVPRYNKKNIQTMLKQYDQPIQQVAVKYTVYEVYGENDGKIGADFQSWKNNDGMDLLSMGGRYRSNWTATFAGGIDPDAGSNKTQFFSVNPKWNSKYLDFLTSKGNAKVMTTGQIVVKHGSTGTINKGNRVFYNEKTAATNQKITVTSSTAVLAGVNPTIGNDGSSDVIYNNAAADTVFAVKFASTTDGTGMYQIAAATGFFTKDGKNLGSQTTVKNLSTALTWTTVPTNDITSEKGPVITSKVSNNFGFVMSVTPKIGSEATTLNVEVTNSSLIGWKSDGAPRISDANEIKTQVVISNKSNRFVLGGVEKSNVVRSVSGIPYLRRIPILGWLFGSESESTKKSQLVVVAECELISLDHMANGVVTGEMTGIEEKTKDAGKTNAWGFDQYLIDKK